MTFLFYLFIFGTASHFFMHMYYKSCYYNSLMNISCQIILWYSRCELYVKRLFFPRWKEVQRIWSSLQTKYEIEVIKRNEVILKTTREKVCKQDLLLCDMMIVSNIDNENSVIYKQFLTRRIELPLQNEIVPCTFTFIAMTVKMNEKSWSIKLSNETENYYIVGNILNRYVISYLLKKQHGIICDEINGTYELIIFDQTANMVTCNEKDEIILKENCYEIVPFVTVDITHE